MKPIYLKSPKATEINLREVSAMCKVKTENGEIETSAKVKVTDASLKNVKSKLSKILNGVLISFRVSRIAAVYG